MKRAAGYLGLEALATTDGVPLTSWAFADLWERKNWHQLESNPRPTHRDTTLPVTRNSAIIGLGLAMPSSDDYFQNRDDVKVLLLPVTSGANGLNLVSASHVLLIEPILNPAQELQAVGRVHRIGQNKPTVVHKFVIKSTIEERMHHMLRYSDKTQSPDLTAPQPRLTRSTFFPSLQTLRRKAQGFAVKCSLFLYCRQAHFVT